VRFIQNWWVDGALVTAIFQLAKLHQEEKRKRKRK
jgi:hypothetical protein